MHYNSYAEFFKREFGGRAQKLSIDGGFGCPNRDGTKGNGGCVFCNNEAFNPSYCRKCGSITEQIDEGIAFHRKRYRKSVCYLAYFQAYSNTYGSLAELREKYEEALGHEEIAGIIIGTRPDCVDEEKLDYIASLKERGFVAVEYGIESCYDRTLDRINRGHDFACTKRAIEATATRGIHCGGHLILGLPGETREEMVEEAKIVNGLPLNTLKLHQLQILKGTVLAENMERGEEERVRQFGLEEYIGLVCDFVERLREDVVVERLAGEVPPRYQACPERSWRRDDGRLIRYEEIVAMVEKEFERRGSRQGCRL